jgi:hypothetical protein
MESFICIILLCLCCCWMIIPDYNNCDNLQQQLLFYSIFQNDAIITYSNAIYFPSYFLFYKSVYLSNHGMCNWLKHNTIHHVNNSSCSIGSFSIDTNAIFLNLSQEFLEIHVNLFFEIDYLQYSNYLLW